MNVIAVLNEKGGVAKTTTAVNLADGLARLRYRVLLIDMDPQSNATVNVGLDPNDYAERHIGEALLDFDPDLANSIVDLPGRNLWAIPSNRALRTAADELIDQGRPLERLQNALDPLQGRFDYVVLDLPPTIEVLQEMAIESADGFVIPLELGRFALDGLGNLILKLTERRAAHGTWSFRILLSRVTGRTPRTNLLATEELSELSDYVLRTQIRFTAKIPESQNERESIFSYAPLSLAARDFRKLAKEIATIWPSRTKV